MSKYYQYQLNTIKKKKKDYKKKLMKDIEIFLKKKKKKKAYNFIIKSITRSLIIFKVDFTVQPRYTS